MHSFCTEQGHCGVLACTPRVCRATHSQQPWDWVTSEPCLLFQSIRACHLLGVQSSQTERCVMSRYVRQFREIFTEEGRRQVKITHQVPGRAPVVTYTQVCNTAALTTTKSAASSSAAQPITSTAKVFTCTHLCTHVYTCTHSVAELHSQLPALLRYLRVHTCVLTCTHLVAELHSQLPPLLRYLPVHTCVLTCTHLVA